MEMMQGGFTFVLFLLSKPPFTILVFLSQFRRAIFAEFLIFTPLGRFVKVILLKLLDCGKWNLILKIYYDKNMMFSVISGKRWL